MISIDRRDGGQRGTPGEKIPSTSIVLDWARNVVAPGNKDKQLRNRVISLYADLPQIINGNSSRGVHARLSQYANDHNWRVLAPQVTRLVSQLPETISDEQRELAGLVGIMNVAIDRQTDKPGISFSADEFLSRRANLEYFGEEDWLTSLAFLVEINGQKKERERKNLAQTQNLTYLEDLDRPVQLDDIKNMYGNVATAIYPQAVNISPIRDFSLSEDEGLILIAQNTSLEHFVENQTAGDRERAVRLFLDIYNYRLNSPWFQPEYDLAWIYSVYLAIHPHPDGNGTMARTLVDNYCLKTGIDRIAWGEIESHTDAFIQYLSDMPAGMAKLLKNTPRIPSTNN